MLGYHSYAMVAYKGSSAHSAPKWKLMHLSTPTLKGLPGHPLNRKREDSNPSPGLESDRGNYCSNICEGLANGQGDLLPAKGLMWLWMFVLTALLSDI